MPQGSDMSYSCAGTPVWAKISSLYLVDSCRREVVLIPSLTSAILRLTNIGRDWARCRPIRRWMLYPCLYVVVSSTFVSFVPVFSCMCRWSLPPRPLPVQLDASSTLEVSAASAFSLAVSSKVWRCLETPSTDEPRRGGSPLPVFALVGAQLPACGAFASRVLQHSY